MDNIPIAQKKLQILQFVWDFILCSTRVRQKITCTASNTTFGELNPNFLCILEMEGGGLPIPPSKACFEIIGSVTGIDYALKTVIERDRISISALKFCETWSWWFLALFVVNLGLLRILGFWTLSRWWVATSRSESVFFCAFLLVSFDWLRLMGISDFRDLWIQSWENMNTQSQLP